MEPHSSQQSGTFRPLQALLHSLRTALHDLSKPGSDASVAQSDAHVSPASLWTAIKTLFFQPLCRFLATLLRHLWPSWTLVGMVKLTALCGIGSTLWIWSRGRDRKKPRTLPNASAGDESRRSDVDPLSTDPSLLKKHSTFQSYAVPSLGLTYPSIRSFFRPHPQQEQLPLTPRPLPLLVFIHGLGGSAAQFNPLLVSLVKLGSCLAIDLPGCGRSTFEPKVWEAYTTEALVRLIAVAIEAHRDRDRRQGVILIGHSMGCSLAALLASPSSPYSDLISEHVLGLVAICPQAEPLTPQQASAFKMFAWAPESIFDLYRKWDRKGGINSSSVIRMTGPNADDDTKKLQYQFNRQSRTPVWQRMALGMVTDFSTGDPRGGLPGRDVWSGLHLPVFLAAGADDAVTPPENIAKIVRFLGKEAPAATNTAEMRSVPVAAAPIDPARIEPAIEERKHQDSGIDASDLPTGEDRFPSETSTFSSSGESLVTEVKDDADKERQENIPPEQLPRRLVLKTNTLPSPASHSLPFATSSSRTLAGLIDSFLSSHVDRRLSVGWQLHHLSTEGKWEVKNLEKWKQVEPVSLPIGNVFRAMKTLREVDEQHTPKIFVEQWKEKIRAVVDISHDNPVYNPKGLEEGGIAYRKYPTVSKHPPTPEEVTGFIALIDQLRDEFSLNGPNPPAIGVHCHYGFNRTGFFLVCYMVERLGYRLEDAIDEFARARRPHGIRHQHFLDQLHVRYCVGLKRAPTL